MSSQQSDSGIPVLTEIIGAPVYGVDLPERRVVLQPAPYVVAVALPLKMDQAFDDSTLQRIEHEVAERVLQQLMGRVDFVLEQRIRDSLADVLQTAVDGLACQLRFGLKETLEDVLTRAVSLEMKNLQSSKS